MSDRSVPTPLASQRFGRYPEYRDSGVEWLGQVPGHWEVVPLKRVARFSGGAGFPVSYQGDERGHILFAKVSDMNRHGNDRELASTANTVTRAIAGELGAHVFPQGTIVFPKVGGALLTNKRRVLVRETCIDNNLMGCVVTGADGEFLFWTLRWIDLGRMSKPGPVPAISEGEVREVPVPLPPRAEQAAIARILDRETARLDALVAKQHELIKLLREKRTALISHTVTKGLDPDVPMKDCGVEWLGEIPAHWEVAALRYRYEQSLGKMLDTKRITGDHLVPYLRNVDVQWDNINSSDLPSMDIRAHEIERFTVRPGDLLVCEGGEAGRCAIWQGDLDPCGYQKALHRLRPLTRGRERPRFLYYTLAAAVARGAFADGQGSTIAHLTGDMLRAHRFPFPLTAEQHAIANFLDCETARIDAMIAKVNQAIEHLNEYRTALISAAVTGKIDVRHHAEHMVSENTPTTQARP